MALFDLDDLRSRGFGGFIEIHQLGRPEPAELPTKSGVYVIARTESGPPAFLESSRGGWWKKKDPSVSLARLAREWVDTRAVTRFLAQPSACAAPSSVKPRSSIALTALASS